MFTAFFKVKNMYLLRKMIELRISIVFILLICSFEVRASLRLVENGASRYTILIDKNAPTSVQDSVQELERFFYKKTGIHLRIVNDEEKVGQYFIGVGRLSINNNYLKTYSDGFVIKTKSNNIYIYGNDTKDGEVNEGGGRYTGTANGVYFFLREYLDVNVTNPDAIDKHVSVVSDVVIPKINVVEKSPFFYRELPYIGDDKAVKKWKKYMLLAKTYPIEHGHAWSSTIPPELYDTHPDWFAEVDAKNVRPIDSKYKLETTNPDLVNAYANEVIKVFEKEPNREWYSLSPSDGGGGWSNSKMANDLIEMDHYGHVSRTSLILHFYKGSYST